MRGDMLAKRLTAVLLSLPLLVIIFVSVRYWIKFDKEGRCGSSKQNIPYNKFFLALVGVGYFSIWPLWVGGIVFLYLNRYYSTFNFATFLLPKVSFLQVVGLVILYIGSVFLTWALGFAGKYLRPSISGVCAEHRLVQDGPLGIVRHPYYVSYVLILAGLSLTLTTLWPLVFIICVVVGMGPTAQAEEEQLTTLFGEEYQQYRSRVGRFFPKLLW
jgi:protein-S-isoprenylcysteine O-methyltransferase Ste14